MQTAERLARKTTRRKSVRKQELEGNASALRSQHRRAGLTMAGVSKLRLPQERFKKSGCLFFASKSGCLLFAAGVSKLRLPQEQFNKNLDVCYSQVIWVSVIRNCGSTSENSREQDTARSVSGPFLFSDNRWAPVACCRPL